MWQPDFHVRQKNINFDVIEKNCIDSQKRFFLPFSLTACKNTLALSALHFHSSNSCLFVGTILLVENIKVETNLSKLVRRHKFIKYRHVFILISNQFMSNFTNPHCKYIKASQNT
jgi:hypothetical protein